MQQSMSGDLRLFARYAGQVPERWQVAVGCQVIHVSLGPGTIVGIEKRDPSGVYITVRFDAIPDPFKTFTNESLSHFRSITLPTDEAFVRYADDVAAAEEEAAWQRAARAAESERARQATEAQAAKLRELEEQRRAAIEQQQMLEQRAMAEFAALKTKYHADRHPDPSPTSPLHVMLLKLDSRQPLTDADIEWLRENEVFGTIACHFEDELGRTGDVWNAIKACRYWRDAGEPKEAVAFSDDVMNVSAFTGEPARARAALFTTRGGAFRDLGQLKEAEECGLTAIRINPSSFYPYSLMGALCFETGRPEKGDAYFAKAEELGANRRNQEYEMKNALNKADPASRRAVAEYLLAKDPARYHWATFYLGS